MLLPYQIATLLVFLVFAFYVFDIRAKQGMAPLVAGFWTTAMKLIAGATMAWFVWVVIVKPGVEVADWIALGLIALGTASVVAAKVTLGRFHTWAGYHKVETQLVTHGIYSRIRHPLYTGAILVEIGVGIVLFSYYRDAAPLVLAMIAAAFLYMIPFNIILAGRETEKMREKFGPVMDDYTSRVRAFFPIRKRA
ncbi:MAG: isoprenylcysteine carboxylmethyltransferase family protein [Hyphomicrobiaceae bacterium]|nr:isoprenylcysteine carboxylmethyltransferase family protein [Hyphomicrobiaceae bacterium]